MGTQPGRRGASDDGLGVAAAGLSRQSSAVQHGASSPSPPASRADAPCLKQAKRLYWIPTSCRLKVSGGCKAVLDAHGF